MATTRSPRLARIARLLFWLAVLISIGFAVLPEPPQVPVGDKIQHMLAFGALALLAHVGFYRGSRWAIAIWLSLLGAGIEVLQAIPMLHRDSDVMDWVADTVVVVGVTVFFVALDAVRVARPSG